MSRATKDWPRLPAPEHADLAVIAASFGHLLHEAGVPVTPERSARFAASVTLAEPTEVMELYWLGRITLLSDREQVETYDRLFRQIFRGTIDLAEIDLRTKPQQPAVSMPSDDRAPGEAPPDTVGTQAGGGTGATPDGEAGSDEDAPPSILAAMSADERLGDRDFRACTEEELALIRQLVDRLPFVPPARRARRHRQHRTGRRWDVRATLRRARRTGGDPVDLVMRTHTEKPRRVVLLADVSGSMEPYARVYLHLLRGAVQALGAEAFVFATRLTRLTRALADTDPDIAYQRAAKAAPDWSGGTRIGAALHAFLEQHGRRGMARGAILVIVSDGWETEDPALIATSMERLSRLAHHVIWVNPRKAAAGYQPLVRGMAAALPFVDTFVSGHSVRALQEVLDAISSARDRVPRSVTRPRVAS
jgi:uncharacterized protein with von Willebrand factor type A (vWA) domain